jgi:hypothetical protein
MAIAHIGAALRIECRYRIADAIATQSQNRFIDDDDGELASGYRLPRCISHYDVNCRFSARLESDVARLRLDCQLARERRYLKAESPNCERGPLRKFFGGRAFVVGPHCRAHKINLHEEVRRVAFLDRNPQCEGPSIAIARRSRCPIA